MANIFNETYDNPKEGDKAYVQSIVDNHKDDLKKLDEMFKKYTGSK